MTNLTLESHNRMLERLAKLQMFWLESNQYKIAIKVNYLYNKYKDGDIDHNQVWDLYFLYLHYGDSETMKQRED